MGRSDGRPAPRRLPLRCRLKSESGYVTAEIAMALPALVVLVFGLTTGLVAAAAQVRCIDAAQSGARAAARGESPDAARAAAAAVAPKSARIVATNEGGRISFRVETVIPLPGPLSRLRIPVSHTAVAAEEATTP
jgi:Flp pilus assembly protein TadG